MDIKVKMELKTPSSNDKLSSFNDLRSYSRHWVKDFIDTYKSEVCLWQTKHADYNNHILRNQAYDRLVEKLKEVEAEPDRSMVVRKINSLRSAFRREYRKKCARPDYEPRLWYYNSLAFIADQQYGMKRSFNSINNEVSKYRLHEKEKKRLFSENFDEEEIEEHVEHQNHDEEEISINPYDDNNEDINIKDEHGKMIVNPISVDDEEQMITIEHHHHHHHESQNEVELHHDQRSDKDETQLVTFQNTQREHETQQAVNSITAQQQQQVPVHTIQIQTREAFETGHQDKDHHLKVMNLYKPDCIPVYNTSMVKHEDEYDAVGVNVASKLRAMSHHQRIIAEKLIGDVIFNGQLETLTITSKLIL